MKVEVKYPNNRRWLGYASLGLGIAVCFLLFFYPTLGLKVLWAGLIPVAPLLLFLAPGLWRQICPMGSAAVLPREHGWHLSTQSLPSEALLKKFRFAGLLGLLLIPPLRPWFIDSSGLASGLALVLYSGIAVYLGLRFVGRGVFCNALCPVHFVEVVYGQISKPLHLPVRCGTCDGCSQICVDVQEGASFSKAEAQGLSIYRALALGFPGFVFGWNQIPKQLAEGWGVLYDLYFFPLVGFLASLALFWLLHLGMPRQHRHLLPVFTGILALGIYYWFQVPKLVCLYLSVGCPS